MFFYTEIKIVVYIIIILPKCLTMVQSRLLVRFSLLPYLYPIKKLQIYLSNETMASVFQIIYKS